jgi:hypothetical protein
MEDLVPIRRARWLVLLASTLTACGSSTVSTDTARPLDRSAAEAGVDRGSDLAAADHGIADRRIDTGPPQLLGVWQVTGKDGRGSYDGQLELRDEKGSVQVLRVVRYTGGVTVEGGRELWTAWTGTATTSGLAAKVSVSLQRADFVKSRGGVTRTAADMVPLGVSGDVVVTGATGTAHWSGGLTADDALASRAPNGATPIFVKDRSSTPANDPPDAVSAALFAVLYASFRTLPAVAPYASDPAFQAGVLYLDTDRTDRDFYQAHPDALRVVDKVVDAPSLGETLARANAYRKTLAAKAADFDAETPAKFLEPATGQLVDSVVGGTQNPTGDGALWTAAYVASQAYRYLVTKDASLVPLIAKSAGSIQLLMEIVPDQTTFARTIRAATGAPAPGWHTGAGAYAAYEWLEGGNNDMFKGLFYGTLLSYIALCDPVVSGQEALCARLQTNAQHMVDDLSVAEVGSTYTNGNNLLAAWLAWYLTGDADDLATLTSDWAVQKPLLENASFQTKYLATADWSGTHLTFVTFMGLSLLDARKPLPTGSIAPSLQAGITKMRSDFTAFRMGLWSVLFATKTATPAQVDIDNARWRLREVPSPRMQLAIDHRVSASFVMSPYPNLPWKNDWTTTDRTDSLRGYPLFEQPLDVYVWRSGPFKYEGNREGVEGPSIDYQHAYWLGRYLGLFSATE